MEIGNPHAQYLFEDFHPQVTILPKPFKSTAISFTGYIRCKYKIHQERNDYCFS
jgi:hypothetical protein